MLLIYYVSLKKPLFLILSYILQAVPYCLVMKKLGYRPLLGLLPNVAEYKMCRRVFPRRRAFFRPFILTALLLAYAYYVGPYRGAGMFYVIAAFLIYGIFLAVLYARLAKAFGKNKGFAFGAIVLPPVFLLLLARRGNVFTAPEFRPEKPRSKPVRIARRVIFWILSAAELLVIIAGCGYFAVRQNPPAILLRELAKEYHDDFGGVEATGHIVTNEDVLGPNLTAVTEQSGARGHLCEDHSGDRDTVVFVYMIGSNLENCSASATVNLRQMADATAQGSGLTFVVEAGGSLRWFTDGMAKRSYARYEIADGKITKLEDLSGDTNMAQPQALEDFLFWAAQNYDADRNMLVFWDHGGGVTLGFGTDDVNGASSDTITAADMADIIGRSGMTFDIIGFDACLMQDIELASALAPYADYLIASEDSEGSFGWYYTYAFGNLAKDPGMSSVEFGEQLIACVNPYSEVGGSSGVDYPTLSMLDLPLAESACSLLSDYLYAAAQKIAADPECFSDVAMAASDAYCFDDMQLDLIDFLTYLDGTDTDRSVAGEEETRDLLNAVRACVVCRNSSVLDGINGVAFSFPYSNTAYYDYTAEQLEQLGLDGEKYAFDVIFSIMVARQENTMDNLGGFGDLLSVLTDGSLYMTESSWYIEGFEDYDDTTPAADIPLTESGGGYQAALPSDAAGLITEAYTAVFLQVDDDGTGTALQFIGSDSSGGTAGSDGVLFVPGENRVYIGGQPVCYEADRSLITRGGIVYTGRVRALLNGTKEIYIILQWDAGAGTAQILGYTECSDSDTEKPDRGYTQLKTGDSIRFLFDYYDTDGNFLETRAEGRRIRITNPDRLKVTTEPAEPCTVVFCGILRDIYGRVMTTEPITTQIG